MVQTRRKNHAEWSVFARFLVKRAGGLPHFGAFRMDGKANWVNLLTLDQWLKSFLSNGASGVTHFAWFECGCKHHAYWSIFAEARRPAAWGPSSASCLTRFPSGTEIALDVARTLSDGILKNWRRGQPRLRSALLGILVFDFWNCATSWQWSHESPYSELRAI